MVRIEIKCDKIEKIVKEKGQELVLKNMDKNRMKGQPKKAELVLREIRQAQKSGRLWESLVEQFSQPFCVSSLWMCRSYIHSLPEECYVAEDPAGRVMISIRAMLAAMENDLTAAKHYVSLLGESGRHPDIAQCTETDLVRIMTELAMPYVSDNHFFHNVYYLKQVGAPPVQSLTLAAGRPSIINGFRDFSRYAKQIMEKQPGPVDVIQTLYGEKGAWVIEIAQAECYYQADDSFHALVLVTGAIPMMESMQDVQCLFAAMAVQMRILLLNGQAQAAAPLMKKIRDRIVRTGWEELTTSLNALEARAACYDGRRDIVERWLSQQAPDENQDLFMMDVYAFLAKLRCYLMTGKYMLAEVLAQRLINILGAGRRYMDICECYMLSAFACCKAGDEDLVCEKMEKVLALAKRYHYIRMLADEGICMVRALSIYHSRRGSDAFSEYIMELALEVAKRFPDYMKTPDEYYDPLSPSEKQILRMMAKGYSQEAIADKLSKKIGTVKFHCSGIYKKLDVKNRQQALAKASELGII